MQPATGGGSKMSKRKRERGNSPSPVDESVRRGAEMELCDQDAPSVESAVVAVQELHESSKKRSEMMHIQIRRFQVKSSDPQQICERAGRELLPTLQSLPGFVDYMTAY